MPSPSRSSSIPAVALDEQALIQECDVKFTRRGGPGGQHRNKVSSAVVLKHRPTGVTAEASERRSQAENRSVAVARLRVELAIQVREEVEAFVVPLVRQYGGSQFRVAIGNEVYPVILADVLNRTLANEGDVATAAEFWCTTASQIVRFLRQEPQALATVNQAREKAGRHRLK
ncbi:Peptide chain release factor 2 [Rosistilla carotiformis]|uniref:Peptide chain release factor 2 n=1 Tax=Rosistilla carotiformis TaxID=2528017 RepID=A0A518JVP7_9BACT|nr:peptide chain release factor-like protein [Rosistilla carotiformis]QDV69613.1 Peptide chain release factor 2 [Rosistilla carotiformis]